jgi:SAM-dependent methyltransferase
MLLEPITQKQRFQQILPFVMDEIGKVLLDVGCGNGKLMNHFSNIMYIGIDKLNGQDVMVYLKKINKKYDYIAALALIEYLDDFDKFLYLCYKRLVKGGLLLITTLKKEGEKYIKMYSKCDCHQQYFTKSDFENLTLFRLLYYNTFELGMNQVVVLQK